MCVLCVCYVCFMCLCARHAHVWCVRAVAAARREQGQHTLSVQLLGNAAVHRQVGEQAFLRVEQLVHGRLLRNGWFQNMVCVLGFFPTVFFCFPYLFPQITKTKQRKSKKRKNAPLASAPRSKRAVTAGQASHWTSVASAGRAVAKTPAPGTSPSL